MLYNMLNRNVKKSIVSPRIYSFINKGALFLETDSFQEFMIGLEIDGFTSKRGKGKSALYFVGKNLIDSSSNENNEKIMGYHCSKLSHFLPLKRFRK